MVTEQSLRNLETAFHKAVRSTLVRESSDVCDITPFKLQEIKSAPGSSVLLMTLSSFVFRLLMIYRIEDNAADRAYYLSAAGAQPMDEVFAEMANMCGGALNRDLSEDFPHLAMSTPYLVSHECLRFLDDLNPQYVSSYLVTINASVQLQATLCLCCSAPIEIAINATAARTEEVVGELELF